MLRKELLMARYFHQTNVIYILILIAVIVGVDFLFFKNLFWERLAANIGIVLLFAAFYFRFLKP